MPENASNPADHPAPPRALAAVGPPPLRSGGPTAAKPAPHPSLTSHPQSAAILPSGASLLDRHPLHFWSALYTERKTAKKRQIAVCHKRRGGGLRSGPFRRSRSQAELETLPGIGPRWPRPSLRGGLTTQPRICCGSKESAKRGLRPLRHWLWSRGGVGRAERGGCDRVGRGRPTSLGEQGDGPPSGHLFRGARSAAINR